MSPVFRCNFLLIIGLLTVVGCGTPKTPYKVVPLEGTITFKGKPLEGVVLQFMVEKNRPSGAFVKTAGKFEAVHTPALKGVPVGQCTLSVSWGSDNEPPAEYKELFAKYGTDGSSVYSFEVTKADKDFKIDLE